MIFESGGDKESKSKIIRNARERALEPEEAAGEIKPNNPENKEELVRQKAETAKMELEIEESDIEKIKKIGKETGIDVSGLIQEKEERREKIKKEVEEKLRIF